jgi:uncharacterized protein GlcG (DUF336 family)
MLKTVLASVALAGALVAFPAAAQTPYGQITLEQAKRIMAAAEAEARKNNWPVAIAILDSGGHLVMLQKLDNTQFASVQIAQDKAYSAVSYKRPSKAFQDGLAKGAEGWRILQLHRATAVDGGLPIVIDGKIVGGIGTSGVQGFEDAIVSKAGADAVK